MPKMLPTDTLQSMLLLPSWGVRGDEGFNDLGAAAVAPALSQASSAPGGPSRRRSEHRGGRSGRSPSHSPPRLRRGIGREGPRGRAQRRLSAERAQARKPEHEFSRFSPPAPMRLTRPAATECEISRARQRHLPTPFRSSAPVYLSELMKMSFEITSSCIRGNGKVKVALIGTKRPPAACHHAADFCARHTFFCSSPVTFEVPCRPWRP